MRRFNESIYLPFFGAPEYIPITIDEQSYKDDTRLEITGKAGFPLLGLAQDTSITLVVNYDDEGDIQVTIDYQLETGWKFSESFPYLPINEHTGDACLDNLIIHDAHFCLSTHNKQGYQAGLNFYGKLESRGLLGVAEKILGQDDVHDIKGIIAFNYDSASYPELPENILSWKMNSDIPGISLYSDLGFSLPVSKEESTQTGGITFTDTRLYVYSPIYDIWSYYDRIYEPVSAYAGELVIPGFVPPDSQESVGVKITAIIPDEPENGLIIRGEFEGFSLGNLGHSLTTLVGNEDMLNIIPEEIQKTLGNFALTETAVHFLPTNNALSIASLQFSIGVKHEQKWTLIGDLLAIGFRELRLVIVNPFDNRRLVTATLAAELEVFGVDLVVLVNAPDLFVTAKQEGQAHINLSTACQKLGLPMLPDIKLSNLSVAIQPESFYSFSMEIAQGECWEIKEGVTLPSVKLELSSNGFFLEAFSEDQEGILLFDILEALTDGIDSIPSLVLPQTLKSFSITGLSLNYSRHSNDFSLSFDGSLKLDSTGNGAVSSILAGLSIDIIHQHDEDAHKQLGGYLLLNPDSASPLYFDIKLENNSDLNAFIASYSNENGSPCKVKPLVEKISPTLGDHIPGTLEFALKHALISYVSIEKKPAYVMALDIDTGINLADLHLDGLPLIGEGVAKETSFKLAFQVLLANKDIADAQAKILESMDSSGSGLFSNKIVQGLSLAASVRIGDESRSLALPIGMSREPEPGSTGLIGLEEVTGEVIEAESTSVHANLVTSDGTQWMKIQKSIGPIHVERIGINYKQGKIWCLLDAGLTIAGLTISLDGLSVSSLVNPIKPEFAINGLGIDYSNGPLEIGGSFLRLDASRSIEQPDNTTITQEYVSYAGEALIRTKQFTLSAIGSYADFAGHPSMFIYAVLDYPLGGPSFFFVTGLAAGFGYNRELVMPSIDQVNSFPLISEVMGEQESIPEGRENQHTVLTDRLNKLEDYLPESIGQNFLAVGVRFSSFRIIDSFALLTVSFGRRLEIDVLGLSRLVAPTPEKGKEVTPLAEVNMDLEARFIPDEGILEVRAQLAPDSYILSRNCQLVGGFAFYSWFVDQKPEKDIVAGDFVITLGGYHPKYPKPKHYPSVPRLGINWPVSNELSIKGNAYYALTGNALMAGGHLEAHWRSGGLHAWFYADADFLCMWKPYYYDSRMRVQLGASYTFDFFGTHTISAEFGADLHIWGPEFSGTASVSWYIISFTVSFGSASATGVQAITWSQFRDSFLPSEKEICSVALKNGLLRKINHDRQGDKDGNDRWIVERKNFNLVTNTLIPASKGVIVTSSKSAKTQPLKTGKANTDVYATPVGIDSCITSSHTITITKTITKSEKIDMWEDFDFEPILKSMPAAQWSKPKIARQSGSNVLISPPDLKDASLVEDKLVGYSISPKNADLPGTPVLLDMGKYVQNPSSMSDSNQWDLTGADSFEQLSTVHDWASVQSAVTNNAQRDDLLHALGFNDGHTIIRNPSDQEIALPESKASRG